MVRTPCSHCWGPASIPGWIPAAKIPQSEGRSQKKKERERTNKLVATSGEREGQRGKVGVGD